MARLKHNYTRHPRAILWLLRGGAVRIGGLDPESRPVFTARVAPFYIGKLPISNRQFEAFRPEFRRSAAAARDDDPVTGVSYADARAYCAWYARISRKPIRLPTEIEWEYACRAGSTQRFFCGDDAAQADAYQWDLDNSGGVLRPLADKRPNAFGLVGMLGGVWEWTCSPYASYPLAAGNGDPDTAADVARVMRGGSFRTARNVMGCAMRRPADPAARHDDLGFRIARSLRPTDAADE